MAQLDSEGPLPYCGENCGGDEDLRPEFNNADEGTREGIEILNSGPMHPVPVVPPPQGGYLSRIGTNGYDLGDGMYLNGSLGADQFEGSFIWENDCDQSLSLQISLDENERLPTCVESLREQEFDATEVCAEHVVPGLERLISRTLTDEERQQRDEERQAQEQERLRLEWEERERLRLHRNQLIP